MHKVRDVVEEIDRRVRQLETVALFVLIVAMTALAFAEVVFRYMHQPLVWSEEITRYLFVWTSLVGAGAAFGTGGHFGVSLIVDKLSPALRRGAGTLVACLVVIFAVVLLVAGYRVILESSGVMASSVDMSLSWFYSAIPVGCALILWHLLARAVLYGPHAHPSDSRVAKSAKEV